MRPSDPSTGSRSPRVGGRGDNPFFHRGPILDAAYFFDRKQETADILGLVANKQNVSVVGGIKRGKTSLLLHLQRDDTLRRHGLDASCCLRPYLSMEGLANLSAAAFFHRLLREVLRLPSSPAISDRHDRLAPVGELSFAELEAAFDDLARAGMSVVFLIDEFELAGENPHFDLNFFSALRSLASRPNCAFVVATEDRLDRLALADRKVGSPFADLFTTIRLSLFSRAAVGEMARTLADRAGRLWEVSLDRIMDWSGGHPHAAQIACSLLWARSAGATKALSDADYDYVFDEFRDQTEAFCAYSWRRLSDPQREALLDIAAGGVRADAADREVVRELLHQQAVSEQDGLLAIVGRALRVFVDARRREREGRASEFLAVAEAAEQSDSAALATGPDDKRMIYKVVRALVKATEARDHLTRGHSDATAHCAVAIAGRLGLLPEEVEGIKIAARLHDIGKLGVSDLILLKPDKLSDKERELVKAHVLVSAHILEALDFPWEVKPAVRFHHERLDGSGYPDGLIGDEIPLSARVLAVADVFSAMTAARSHRAPRPREEAIGEITKHAGTKYDPQVVSAFMQVVEAGGL